MCLQAYFSYKCCLTCGIPQVTLEGTKEDWERILSRLEKLKEYGVETLAWYHLFLEQSHALSQNGQRTELLHGLAQRILRLESGWQVASVQMGARSQGKHHSRRNTFSDRSTTFQSPVDFDPATISSDDFMATYFGPFYSDRQTNLRL